MVNGADPRDPRATLQALYGRGRRFEPLPPEQRIDVQLETLRDLVLELIMEVEVLREALIRESQRAGIPPHTSSYGQAYRETALLTHNMRGVYVGWEHLLGAWHGWPNQPRLQTPRGWPMRESVLMRRLGFSEQEIDQYAEEADDANRPA